MCTARFLYYFSVYVNLFKELFSCLLTGVFPKSECKGMDFCDTLQMFLRLFFKNDAKRLKNNAEKLKSDGGKP